MEGARRARPQLRDPGRDGHRHPFAVWAPNARGVRVVGDFNYWDGRALPDALARLVRRLGAVRPGVGDGARYKFEILGADGQWRHEGRPDGVALRGTARRPRRSSRRRSYEWGDDEWLARRASTQCTRRRCRSTRCTSAPGGLGLTYRAARRGTRRLRRRGRVHPRRVAAGRRAPVRRLVGLPGDVLLRADLRGSAPRTTSGTWSTRCTRPASASSSTGCRRTSRRTTGRWPGSTARRCTSTPTRGAASSPTGARSSSTSAARGAQLPGRQRRLLVRGVPHRRAAGRRRRLDALPRLLAQGGRVDAERARRPGEPRRGGLPAGDERDRLPAGAGRGDDRRGVHGLAGRHPARRIWAAWASASSGTWAGCTTR